MNQIEDFLRRRQAVIGERGWIWVNVVPRPGQPESPFAYTVGLTEHHHAELLTTGLDPATARSILAPLAERVVRKQEQFRHGQHLNIPGWTDVVIVDGTPAGYLDPNVAVALYGADAVRLQQVVWSDRHGQFPWQPRYELSPTDQPLLGWLDRPGHPGGTAVPT